MVTITPSAIIFSTEQIADDAVETDDIADNQVTLAKQAHGTQGGIPFFGASGAPSELAAGVAGQALISNGVGANPSFGSVGNWILDSTINPSSVAIDTYSAIDPSTANRNIFRVQGQLVWSNRSSGTSDVVVRINNGSDSAYVNFSLTGSATVAITTTAAGWKCGATGLNVTVVAFDLIFGGNIATSMNVPFGVLLDSDTAAGQLARGGYYNGTERGSVDEVDIALVGGTGGTYSGEVNLYFAGDLE